MRAMKTMKCCTVALVLCAGSALYAANTYSYDPDDAKTYIVTVPEGETNELSDAAISVITGGSVTNIVKRGEGALSVFEDLSGFTGNVHIDEGVYLSRPQKAANTTLGALSGDVVIANRATLAVQTSVQYVSLSGKKIYFEGDGYGGQGALVNVSGNPTSTTMFGKSLNLTGNGKVASYSGNTFYLVVSQGVLALNGHTLTTYADGNPIVIERPYKYTGDSGDIYVTGDGVRYNSGEGYYFNHRPRIMENSQMVFGSLQHYYQGQLTLEPGAKIRIASSQALSTAFSDTQDNWHGKLVLNDPVRNRVELNGYRFGFNKVVSGGGLFIAGGTGSSPGGQFRISNTDNTFTNGIVATDGAAIFLAGYSALPNKGPLILTNSSVTATGSHATGATWMLPQLFVHGTGLVANATGTWKTSVTKTGDGELVYNSWINSNVLNLNGGRFTFPAKEYPGTVDQGKDDRIPRFNTINASPGTMLDLNGHCYTNNNLNGLTTILNCPEFAVKKAFGFSASNAIEGAGLVTEGVFRFMDGATVSVADVPEKASPDGVMATVLSAAGGIVGFPGCSIGGKWKLTLSADGKSLVLSHPPKVGMILLFK